MSLYEKHKLGNLYLKKIRKNGSWRRHRKSQKGNKIEHVYIKEWILLFKTMNVDDFDLRPVDNAFKQNLAFRKLPEYGNIFGQLLYKS